MKLQFLFAVVLFVLPAVATADAPHKLDFAHDVLPVLARKCFACHGPDKAEGGLRLTGRETATALLESGEHAVVPGQPDASELLRRISSDDEDERMPPSGKPLTAEQTALIREWIASGAEWKNHWAFEPVTSPQPPAVKNVAWARNPIDAFILARLEARGLAPAPPADKIALLRRATYDMTGLPPAPAEVDAFLADADSQAFARVVDRLLASPQYGEHWARHWLDLVRYAETNSYERDGDKPHIWRYRDYVIRSLNDDKPYDQFIREQIAGDELPQATNDSVIATGYYRLGVLDDEPADREQAKFDQLDDLITTTSQAFLALTVNCARCHDHKLDPIAQRDYYRFGALFAGLSPLSTHGPQVEIPIFASAESEAAFHRAEEELRQQRSAAAAEFKEFEDTLAARLREEHGEDPRLRSSDIENLEFRYYRDTWERLPDFAAIKAETAGQIPHGLFDIGLATREIAFGFVFNGLLLVPAEGDYTFYLDSDDGSRLRVNDQVIAEFDGIHGMGPPKQGTMHLVKGSARIELQYFQRESGLGLAVEWEGPGVKRRSLSAVRGKHYSNQRFNIRTLIFDEGERLFGKADVEHYRKLLRRLDNINGKKIEGEYAFAARELHSHPPATHLMERGNAHAPGVEVEPGFPAVLGGGGVHAPPKEIAERSSQRRLQLAEWLASPDNKLTSRVMANRIWQHHFGRGIVRSPNNFGALGVPPTHPELLDWLAGEFVRGGWRMKALHRQILLSNAYQMSSRVAAEALAADPANDLFSHFDMRRLSAEETRDAILAIDGQLNLKMFGPSVYPEISPEVLATQSRPGEGWRKPTAEDESRRSIYIHVKRSLITPLLAALDFPDTDTSCEARFCTTQPGQALTMLNSKFLNDAAGRFAARIAREAGADPAARITLALRLALGRPPEPAEIERELKFIAGLQTKFGLSQDAAWKSFCLTVANRNEFMFLD